LPVRRAHLGAQYACTGSQLCAYKMFDHLAFLVAQRDQNFLKRMSASDVTGKLELIGR
jgi:hypothetical protein